MERSVIAQKKFILLREQAEKIMAAGNFTELPDSNQSPLKLIHELQTLQIELEMQIDELHRSQEELSKSKADYTELYDHAPVGYMTTNAKGMILMANKTLADMLSIPREALINKPVFNHIVPEDQDTYYLYMKNLSDVKQKNICEVRMQKKDGATFYVQLESTIIPNESGKPDSYRIIVIDITERKKAENLLQNSEGRLKALSEATFEAIFFYINGTCVDQNKTAEKMFGYTREDAFGKKAVEWVIPEDRKRLQSNINSNYEKTFKITALRNDGTTFPCEMQVRSSHCNGNPIRIAAFRDISERKLIEDALFFKEDIIKSSSSVITTCDLDGNMTYGNPSFLESWGFKDPKEFLGKPFWKFWQVEDRLNEINQSLENNGAWSSELKAIRKDGTMFDAHISTDTVFDSRGKPIGLSTTAIDITDRKKAVEALQASEEKYRSMMESMMDAAYICSSDFQVEYMNPRMMNLTGNDITNTPCYKSIFNRGAKCPWCVLDKIQKGKHIEKEVTNPFDNRIYGMTSSPIYHADSTISMLTILRDTTEKKAIEKQLHQARKMESIGTLAGGIAHDFNNLLYMIVGNTELAIEKIPKSNPAHKNLKEVISACMKSAGIIKQLLNFSRKTEQEFKPIKAVAVIEDALTFLRSIIPSTIEFHKNLPKSNVTIVADPIQINQVLMNILTNASHAMEETGGSLEVTVEQTIVDENSGKILELSAGDYLKISISDTGPGVHPEIIDKIFDPYYTTKRVGKGSGMGLAVVHGIVRNHNGTITVESQIEKGTTFNIYFPVFGETPEVETKPPEMLPRGSETILFVDDEESIVNMTHEMLEMMGYTVESKMNPEEALSLFKSRPDYFDLIITDMTMPQMTGVQLSEKLLKIRPDIPIIICTGHSRLMNEEKAKAIGIKEYMTKPTSRLKMANTIRNVLSKKSE